MNGVLWLLALQGASGAFDTLYFHEWRARLPGRPEMRSELRLHAARSVIYGIVFCTLPWVPWLGPAGWLLVALLLIEAVITFTDFVVEDRVRAPLGGVYPGERVMHGFMAVVYGAFMAGLIPQLSQWLGGSGVALGAQAPAHLLIGLTALGIGSVLSGVRDALAAGGVAVAAWPWVPPHTEVTHERVPAPRPSLGLALVVVAVIALAARRAR